MRRTHGVLIPLRFSTLIIQIVFTIVAIFVRGTNASYFPDQINSEKKSIIACCVVFYIFEFAELVIILTGVTLFQDKLSLFQIICHTFATALLAWYLYLLWGSRSLWGIWALGSLLPIIFECGGILFTYLFYRKVLRLN